jgi:hypothetical protein
VPASSTTCEQQWTSTLTSTTPSQSRMQHLPTESSCAKLKEAQEAIQHGQPCCDNTGRQYEVGRAVARSNSLPSEYETARQHQLNESHPAHPLGVSVIQNLQWIRHELPVPVNRSSPSHRSLGRPTTVPRLCHGLRNAHCAARQATRSGIFLTA